MGDVIKEIIEQKMKSAYVDYAMSVIVGRALPDVRDGLKPVHRRVLYAMHDLDLSAGKQYKKCARIVGEVLGKYHPHGDSAVYETLVRMAQSFSLRYPLVDGQGNFGCFTKDTRVRLADGRNISFGELVDEDATGKENYTFTVNSAGNISIGKISRPRLTIKDAQIMKVVLDTGDEIRCTPNHRFMLRTGKYREARDLRAGDSLMPLYTRISSKEPDPNLAGYEMVLQPESSRWEFAHVLADDWNIMKGTYSTSAGRIRHHADFNKLNNNPTNIRRMNWKEHWRIHYLQSSEKHRTDYAYREKLAKGRMKFWSEQSNRDTYSRRASERNRQNWTTPSYRLTMGKKLSMINKEYIASHPEKRREFGDRATKTLKRLWQDTNYRNIMRENIIKGNKNRVSNKTGRLKFLTICRRTVAENTLLCEESYERFRNDVYSYGHATSWKTGLQKYFDNNPSLILCELNGNHRVSRTERLTQTEDVYDLTVGETHNFPLACGVFVHNSIDGDNAAAMRYTEARLSKIAGEMLIDIDKETIDFKDNFDSTLREPTVLPAKIPNLLVNGSNGIAVGMATNIPPHNLREVGKAVIALLHNPTLSMQDVLGIIRGPDFPTGGVIAGKSGILAAYTTGRGIIQLKGVMTTTPHKDRKRIIITEIPYQVNKAQLIEEIAELVREKKIPDISDMRDESNQEGIRVVLELKKDANPDVVMTQLYQFSRMQVSYSIILLALVNNEPKTLSLMHLLNQYIAHRHSIVVRRSQFELKKSRERAHVLEGLQVALTHIDDVVARIKAAKSVDDAKNVLMSTFTLTAVQAQAILEMRLQRLAQLEREKLTQEYTTVKDTITKLEHLLSHEDAIRDVMKQEMQEVMDKYESPRRTAISDEEADVAIEDLMPETTQVVTITRSGYSKRTPLDIYKVQRRGGKGVIGTDKKEEDVVEHIFVANTRAYLLIFTNKGKVHWLKVWKLPEGSRYSKGKALVNLLELEEGEQVAAIIPVKDFSSTTYLIMATRNGVIKKTKLDEYANPRRGGIRAILFDEGDALVNAIKTKGTSNIILATRHGLASRFNERDVRIVGRTARGVRGIRLEQGDAVIGMVTADDTKTLLTITEHGYGKRTAINEYRLIARGGKGVINIQCGERNGNVASVRAVSDTDEILLVSKEGIMIRTSAIGIPIIGRNTQGVRLMRLAQGDGVVAAARIVEEEKTLERLSTPEPMQ